MVRFNALLKYLDLVQRFSLVVLVKQSELLVLLLF